MKRFVAPNDGDSVLFDARWQFLLAVAKVEPAALEALRCDVWPAYKRLFRIGAKSRPPMQAADTTDLFETMRDDSFANWYCEAVEKGNPTVTSLHRALEQWLQQFRIASPWIRDTALRTIRAWETLPDLATERPHPRWVAKTPSWRAVVGYDLQWFNFTILRGWEPTIQSRANARADIVKEMQRELDAYLDRVAAQALELGYIEREQKRELVHFEYLAHYQTHTPEWSYEKIAAEYKVKSKAVEQAVRRTADLIGIDQRLPAN